MNNLIIEYLYCKSLINHIKKLENVYNDICFLSPKVYGGITTQDKEIIKIKGYKNTPAVIRFNEFKSLLIKDTTLNLQHIKWFRSLVNSNITLKDQVYELQKTENKRIIIYNNDNVAVSTKPYNININ